MVRDREGSFGCPRRAPSLLNPTCEPTDNGEMEPGAILTLTCPRCGEGFPSAMQMDPLTFDAIRLESMIERCSACAHAFRFGRVDYFFAVVGLSLRSYVGEG